MVCILTCVRGNIKMGSQWLNHPQTAAGKVPAICDRFHARIIIILWKLLFELIWKADLTLNKQFCLHQNLITSRSEIFAIATICNRLQMVAIATT